MALVRAAVLRDTETLHTLVDRDHWGTWYELPAELVDTYEQAQAAYVAAQNAITSYIDDNDLQEQED